MTTTPPALAADLDGGLRRLKMAAMRCLAPELLVTAKTQRWTPEEFLRTLVDAEITARDASNARTRMRTAAFPVFKRLDGFDVAASPVPAATFDYLASLEWVRAAENVCLIGPAGSPCQFREVEGWEGLDGTYGLPDPDDEHLVAAAIVASAGVIVTLNLKDLPRSLVPDAIDIQTPAEFAHNPVSLNPPAALRAIAEIARRHRRPPDTVADILTNGAAVRLQRRGHGPAPVPVVRTIAAQRSGRLCRRRNPVAPGGTRSQEL